MAQTVKNLPSVQEPRVQSLGWGIVSFSRGASQPRDWTRGSCTEGRFFTVWATREAPKAFYCFERDPSQQMETHESASRGPWPNCGFWASTEPGAPSPQLLVQGLPALHGAQRHWSHHHQQLGRSPAARCTCSLCVALIHFDFMFSCFPNSTPSV